MKMPPQVLSTRENGKICAFWGIGIRLFLLPPALGVHNLQTIMKSLLTTYKIDGQNAMGINVPAKYCDDVADLDQNFLSQDNDVEKVKNELNLPDRIYNGAELIVAKPKQIPGSQFNLHSEYLLLINSNSKTLAHLDPLMQNLLSKSKTGCGIFFTKNSPCVKTCSKPGGRYSIIPALEMFDQHKGPKAFVFSQVWKHDEDKPEWEVNLSEINKHIPVFRCDRTNCVRCVENNVINIRCKKN
ncbi:hypothetical protein HF521_002693 [Silurus meridionalis]|uniref:Uncharacterized protein n=2 Tax=Silurus meridionalis TaxID=175797 RepID=A0A8T0B2N1_SILME|nr:hypothetical protein HF521_002693 [Silurus meridionalis]